MKNSNPEDIANLLLNGPGRKLKAKMTMGKPANLVTDEDIARAEAEKEEEERKRRGKH